MTELGDRLRALSEEQRTYALRQLPRNLAEGGDHARLQRLLLDFDFLLAKVRALGTGPLEADLERALAILTDQERRALEILRHALRSGAPTLARESVQLASQLVGWLNPGISDGLDALLRVAHAWEEQAWLRPTPGSLAGELGTLVRAFVHPGGAVQTVALSADGQTALLGCDLGTISVWYIDDPRPPDIWHGIGPVTAAALSRDGTLAIWADGSVIRRWSARTDAAPTVIANSDGGFVAAALDASITKVILAHSTGSLLSLDLVAEGDDIFQADHAPVLAVAPDGGHAILLSPRSTAKPDLAAVEGLWGVHMAPTANNFFSVWHLHSGDDEECPYGTQVPGALLDVSGVARIWFVTDRGVSPWELSNVLSDPGTARLTSRPTCLALSHSAQWAIVGMNNGALRTACVFKDPGLVIRAHQGTWPVAVAISDDGRRAVAADRDGKVAAWELAEQPDERAVAWQKAAITGDGRVVVGWSEDFGLWMHDARRPGRPRKVEEEYVTSIALTPNGGRAAWASMQGWLRLCDLDRREEPRTVRVHIPLAVAFSPNGQRVVAGSLGSATAATDANESLGLVHVLDFETGRRETKEPLEIQGWITALAVSSIGVVLVGTRDHGLVLWEIGGPERPTQLADVEGWISAVGISPDGRRMIVGLRERTVLVFDRVGQVAKLLEVHTMSAPVVLAQLSDDGDVSLVGCEDGSVQLRAIGGGSAGFTATGRVISAAVDPRCPTRLACLDASGMLHELELRGNLTPS
jgi:WD40 repeat protein